MLFALAVRCLQCACRQYRRILNRAFGPGAWALVPRGESNLKGKFLCRDYALFCLGRFVAQAKGEHGN